MMLSTSLIVVLLNLVSIVQNKIFKQKRINSKGFSYDCVVAEATGKWMLQVTNARVCARCSQWPALGRAPACQRGRIKRNFGDGGSCRAALVPAARHGEAAASGAGGLIPRAA